MACTQLATLYILTREGQEELGHSNATRAYVEAMTAPPRSDERMNLLHFLSPVEINFDPAQAEAAVAKWARLVGGKQACHVVVRDRRPGQQANRVFLRGIPSDKSGA